MLSYNIVYCTCWNKSYLIKIKGQTGEITTINSPASASTQLFYELPQDPPNMLGLKINKQQQQQKQIIKKGNNLHMYKIYIYMIANTYTSVSPSLHIYTLYGERQKEKNSKFENSMKFWSGNYLYRYCLINNIKEVILINIPSPMYIFS